MKYRLFDFSSGEGVLLVKGGIERVNDHATAIEQVQSELKEGEWITSQADLTAIGFKTIMAEGITGCIELTEEVIRVSAIISDIASKLTEQADRDTGYAQFGFETNNPRTGQNFFGFRSTAVDPKVVEYKETLEVLEEMQVLLIDKCSPDKVDP